MPFSDPKKHLHDVLESIDLINQFIDGMDFDAYQLDEKTQAAVERKLQILTEAVIRLESSGEYPEIDARGYRTMGDFLRYSYHRVSDEIVWNTVKDELPILRRIVVQKLES